MALNFHLILFFQARRLSLSIEIGRHGRRPGECRWGGRETQLQVLWLWRTAFYPNILQPVFLQASGFCPRRGPQGLLGEDHRQERREVLPQVRQGIRGPVGGQGVSQLGDDGHGPPRRREG